MSVSNYCLTHCIQSNVLAIHKSHQNFRTVSNGPVTTCVAAKYANIVDKCRSATQNHPNINDYSYSLYILHIYERSHVETEKFNVRLLHDYLTINFLERLISIYLAANKNIAQAD